MNVIVRTLARILSFLGTIELTESEKKQLKKTRIKA